MDDSTRHPLDGALITLLDSQGKDLGRPGIRTDSLGRFTLHAGVQGKYRLQVSRIGFQVLKTETFTFIGGEALTLNLALSQVAQRLGTVEITERRRLNRDELMSLVGYELRKSKGVGLFLDTLDLAAYKLHPLGWTLENYGTNPQVVLSAGRSGTVVQMVRAGGNCTPEIWIDGWSVAAWRLDVLNAVDVHGMEVYSGFLLPPISIAGEIGIDQQLAPARRKCGAIVVWTKAYVKEVQAKEAKKGSGGL